MEETWDQLLTTLAVTDAVVFDTVTRACFARYQSRATEELRDAILSVVVISLLTRYRTEPHSAYFLTADAFLGAMYTTACRATGPDIRDRPRRSAQFTPLDTETWEPAAPPPPEDDPERARVLELLGNCPAACDRCLPGANDQVRRAFLYWCESTRSRGRLTSNAAVAAHLGVSVSTGRRLMEHARSFFATTCGTRHDQEAAH